MNVLFSVGEIRLYYFERISSYAIMLEFC